MIAHPVFTANRKHRRPVAIGVFLAVAALAAALPAEAQAVDSLDMLALPTTVIMCRSHSPAPEDSAAIVLEFLDGAEQPHGRKSLVAYDSVGGPVYATIIASKASSDGGFTVRGIGVRFVGADPGGSRVSALLKPGERNPTRGDSVRLTSSEFTRARALVAWFWDHRCGRRVSNR